MRVLRGGMLLLAVVTLGTACPSPTPIPEEGDAGTIPTGSSGGGSSGAVSLGSSTAGTSRPGSSSAGTSTAGTSTAGTSRPGSSSGGSSTTGTSTAGTSTAATSTAGTSTAGTSTAGTSTAGTSTGGNSSSAAPGSSGFTNSSSFTIPIPDGGFNLDGGLNFDAGLRERNGTGETGVGCGPAVCEGASPLCCITLGGLGCASMCSPGFSAPFACDGPEDCPTSGTVCCAGVSGAACLPEAQCVHGGTTLADSFKLCNNSTECSVGNERCCESATLAGLGLDVGACFASCN